MKIKILSVVLSVVMLLSLFAGMSLPVTALTEGDYEYEVESDLIDCLKDYLTKGYFEKIIEKFSDLIKNKK